MGQALLKPLTSIKSFNPHFIDEETEASSREFTCSSPYRVSRRRRIRREAGWFQSPSG